jgi:hypothetical protein
MKNFLYIMAIAGFLFIGLSEIQAQTTQVKLNQIELFKQFIGNWRCELAKDTVYYMETRAFGTGLEIYDKTVVKDKVISEVKELYDYDRDLDKYIGVELVKNEGISVLAMWFVSERKVIAVGYKDMPEPDKASFKAEIEFLSSNDATQTIYSNNKFIARHYFTRIK